MGKSLALLSMVLAGSLCVLIASGHGEAGPEADYYVLNDAFPASGGKVVSGNWTLFFTMGEGPAVGYSSNAQYELWSGMAPVPVDTAVTVESVLPPRRYQTAIYPNSPNPFNPRTAIRYEIGTAQDAELDIYDTSGRLVRRFGPLPHAPGVFTFDWDGTNQSGQLVGSGHYLAVLRATDGTFVRRMTLLK